MGTFFERSTPMARERSLEQRLDAHPHLRERIEALLGIVEDAAGDLDRADAAEQRVIEERRRMGNEALHAWASGKTQEKEQQARQGDDSLIGHGKKPLVAHHVRQDPRRGAAVSPRRPRRAAFL
jgi:hypothetical protein